MKRMMAFLALLGVCICASATEDNYFYGCVNKLTRGTVNILTGWVELPAQVYKGYRKGYDDGGAISVQNMPAASRSLGAAAGLFRGVGHACGRTVWGVVDFATFWTKDRLTNKNMLFLLDGDYAWSEGEPKYFFCPTGSDGCNKLSYRIDRGFNDLVYSFGEVPCQTEVYWDRHQNGMVVVGALNGLWLFSSRFVNGATDLVFCLFPSPEDRLQIPYDANHAYDVCDKIDRKYADRIAQ